MGGLNAIVSCPVRFPQRASVLDNGIASVTEPGVALALGADPPHVPVVRCDDVLGDVGRVRGAVGRDGKPRGHGGVHLLFVRYTCRAVLWGAVERAIIEAIVRKHRRV